MAGDGSGAGPGAALEGADAGAPSGPEPQAWRSRSAARRPGCPRNRRCLHPLQAVHMSWAEDSRSACFRSALAFCCCSAYVTSRHDSGSSAASPASWTVPGVVSQRPNQEPPRPAPSSGWGVFSDGSAKARRSHLSAHADAGAPQHFLNFFPLPHGHGWFRPVFPAGCCFAARGSPAGAVGAAQAVARVTRRPARCRSFSACCRNSLASAGRPVLPQTSASRSAMCSASRTPGNRVATAQDLFRPRVVLCLAGTVGRVTVGPADPSPSPAGIVVQPRLVQLVRLLLMPGLEIRAGQRPAEVPGDQRVFSGEPPEPLRGHFEPRRSQLRVMFSAILQRHFEVLAPVEQGLRHRETVVELPDRPGTDGIAHPQHVRPGTEPYPAAGDEVVALVGVVALLDLVVQEFQACLSGHQRCQSSVRQIHAQSASQSCSRSRSLTTSSADSAPSHSPASFSRSASTPRPRSLASRSSSLMPVACDRSGLPLSATRRRMPSSRTISPETIRSSSTQDIFTPWYSLTGHPPSAGRRRSTARLSAAARAAAGRGRRSPGGGRRGRSRRRCRTPSG